MHICAVIAQVIKESFARCRNVQWAISVRCCPLTCKWLRYAVNPAIVVPTNIKTCSKKVFLRDRLKRTSLCGDSITDYSHACSSQWSWSRISFYLCDNLVLIARKPKFTCMNSLLTRASRPSPASQRKFSSFDNISHDRVDTIIPMQTPTFFQLHPKPPCIHSSA